MGTRGHLTFVVDGERKTTYNHWDSYPSGLGADVLGWLRSAATDPGTVDLVRALVVVDPESTPTSAQRDQLRKYANLSVGAQDLSDWYCLLRETQGNPALILESGHLFDGSSYGGIEYCYTVDFDQRTFSASAYRDKPQSWPFDALPSDADFIRAIDGDDEDELVRGRGVSALYKATRPDGTDFRTGTVDYAAALASGNVVTHPDTSPDGLVPNEPWTYLSTSVEPASTLVGGSWPCRLFEVEPVGEVVDGLDACRNKRAVSALRVVAELPAHEALGPQGEQLVALIEKAKHLTADQVKRLAASWDASWDASWAASWAASRAASRDASRATADAAAALSARDLISDTGFTAERYRKLTGPWASVMGPVHPDDERDGLYVPAGAVTS